MSKLVIKTKDQNYGFAVLREMQLLHGDGQLCDIVLVAAMDGQRFSCHRLVLAACSEFFRAMFMCSMRESQQHEIVLGEVYGAQLQPLLNFCYTGAMELNDDETTYDYAAIKELLCTASQLQFVAAVTACADFLYEHLTPANCLGTYALAEQYSLNELQREAKKHRNINFVKVCQNEEYLQLSFEQLALLIASDELNVPSEKTVFLNVFEWVQHDALSRRQHMPELLKLVRLAVLMPNYLATEVRDICMEYECGQLVHEAILWQSESSPPNAASLTQLSLKQTKTRKSENADLLAVYKDGDAIIIDSYCSLANAWTSFGRISPGRFYFAAAILNESLIMVGGLKDRGSLGTVQRFDLKEKTFEELCPLLDPPRYDLGVAVLDGMLYAVGGYNHMSLDILDRYDPETDTWTNLVSMKYARDSLGVAVLDGLLYAVGGRNNEHYHNTTECYNPVTDEWTQRANLNQARRWHGIAAGHGFLYAVAGKCGNEYLSSVERYEPRSNKWTQVCSLSVSVAYVSCALLGERLLAIPAFTGIVKEYNFETNTWIERTKLNNTGVSLKVLSIPKMWHFSAVQEIDN